MVVFSTLRPTQTALWTQSIASILQIRKASSESRVRKYFAVGRSVTQSGSALTRSVKSNGDQIRWLSILMWMTFISKMGKMSSGRIVIDQPKITRSTIWIWLDLRKTMNSSAVLKRVLQHQSTIKVKRLRIYSSFIKQ